MEIGQDFGVTRERVRQLVNRAKGRLRPKLEAQGFRAYLNGSRAT